MKNVVSSAVSSVSNAVSNIISGSSSSSSSDYDNNNDDTTTLDLGAFDDSYGGSSTDGEETPASAEGLESDGTLSGDIGIKIVQAMPEISKYIDGDTVNIADVLSALVQWLLDELLSTIFDIPVQFIDWISNAINEITYCIQGIYQSCIDEFGMFAPIGFTFMFVISAALAIGLIKFLIGLVIPT
ncbi:hypothetical protein [Methanococcus maripaludis]|uniref:hypothetical protein n=1 Tax=Methanococcus maripaludis TaxID=39152 RepID=UPI0012DF1CCA|nr:hypothetical protein [Methanococcus maripaludis]